MTSETYFNQISGQTRFFTLFNFILKNFKADEAVMLTLIISTENIPNVKRLKEDPDYYEVKFWILKEWDETEIAEALRKLKNKGLIEYQVFEEAGEKQVVVKPNFQRIDKIRLSYENSKSKWLQREPEAFGYFKGDQDELNWN